MNLYIITEFNDEKPVVLITLYYFCSIYLYLGNPPFLTLTLEVVYTDLIDIAEWHGLYNLRPVGTLESVNVLSSLLKDLGHKLSSFFFNWNYNSIDPNFTFLNLFVIVITYINSVVFKLYF